MAKIYVDTNRYLDFYRIARDKLHPFDEFEKYKGRLVITDQTYSEFRRNRVCQLNNLIKQLEACMNVSRPHDKVLQLTGSSELTELLEAYLRKAKEVKRKLEELLDENKDPVAKKFFSLAHDKAIQRLIVDDEAIRKAHNRKLLGDPPTSKDKYTIGDEVIWELLLFHMKEDLIIVTRDSTFKDNLPFLSAEYKDRTKKKLLLVTDTFSTALAKVGETPSDELIAAEKKEEEHRPPPLDWLPIDNSDYVLRGYHSPLPPPGLISQPSIIQMELYNKMLELLQKKKEHASDDGIPAGEAS